MSWLLPEHVDILKLRRGSDAQVVKCEEETKALCAKKEQDGTSRDAEMPISRFGVVHTGRPGLLGRHVEFVPNNCGDYSLTSMRGVGSNCLFVHSRRLQIVGEMPPASHLR